MNFLTVLFVTIMFVEAIIEAIDMLTQRFDIKMVYAGVLGGFFSWLFGLNILGWLGISLVVDAEWALVLANVILLAMFFIRWSGSLNDLLEWVKGLRPESSEDLPF